MACRYEFLTRNALMALTSMPDWGRDGRVHRSPGLDSAYEALRLAEAAPAKAVAMAAVTVRRARREGDGVACAVAERAWGLALRHNGDLDRALNHLTRAVRCAEEADARAVAAEARLTLAYALAERGRPERALEELDRALSTLNDAHGRARALAQRGAILLDLGRHDDALDHYREALPPERAFEELSRDAKQGLLNPDLVAIFSGLGTSVLANASAEADALEGSMLPT